MVMGILGLWYLRLEDVGTFLKCIFDSGRLDRVALRLEWFRRCSPVVTSMTFHR